MKALIAIALLALIGWVGYVYLDDMMAQERFGSAVEQAIDDPRTRGIEHMRADIAAAAKQEGMLVDPQAIEFSITGSNAQPVAGQMVSGAGLAVTSKRITVRVPYARSLWGRLKNRTLERSRVYVATAAPGFDLEDKVLSKSGDAP
ncbi:MAG TPA: hypothetical protein VEI24_03875 [Nitrospiria bacterium]|nr:hypothetical protein [Nitrospiria bacterium]